MGRLVRGAAAAAAVCLLCGLFSVVSAVPSDATAPAFYAYAGGTSSPAGCPAETSPSDGCSLTEALSQVSPGATVDLAGDATYYGNWTISTSGTSAAEPVTIKPGPGVSDAVLDGDHTAGTRCSTSACDGPVINVPAGVYADLSSFTIQDADNTSTDYGGGVDTEGTLTASGMSFTNDAAGLDGGAIDNGGAGGAATLTITSSTFSDDSVVGDFGDGGAIDNGDEDGTGTLTITSSTFSDDSAAYDGGAIDSGDDGGTGTVTVISSTFTYDSSGEGGGIDSGDGGNGTLTVTSSTISDDSAANDGGAIDSGDDSGTGTLTVTSSTISDDSASGDGGAIDNGDDFGSGHVTVTSSTFSDDSAVNDGGAIDNGDIAGTGTTTVTSSTLDDNSGAAAVDNANGTVTIAGSILAGDSAGNCTGTITDSGYNLEDDSAASCGFSSADRDIVGQLAGLLSLGNFGGPTETIPLSPSSPAVNAIPSGTAGLCPGTDQRGVPRPQGSGCDMGAYEFTQLTVQAPSFTIVAGQPLPALIPTYVGLLSVLSALATQATCTTTATASSPVGKYPVTCSGAVDPDYSIAYEAGTVTVIVTVPRAPQDLKATSGNRSVALSWAPPSSDGGLTLEGYEIYQGTSSNLADVTEVKGVSPTKLNYDVTGLENGTKYYFAVRASNTLGPGKYSNVPGAIPLSGPAAPTSLKAVFGNTKVSLTWLAPTSDGGTALTGFDLYEGRSPTTLSKLVNAKPLLPRTLRNLSSLLRQCSYDFFCTSV